MWTYNWYINTIRDAMIDNNSFFLRHDVDISLDKALEMAEVEAAVKFHATYYILLSSPFYNALAPENLEKIRMIKDLGMGIGLHYDPSIKPGMSNEDYKNEIMVQIGLLEHHVGMFNGISMTVHKPVMGKDVDIELVNMLNKEDVYVPNFDSRFKYVSDSGHNWRENIKEVMQQYEHIHLNTHPEWYNKKEMSMEECLYDLKLDKISDRLIRKEVKNIREYIIRISDNK